MTKPINELSKKLLSRYVKQAHDSAMHNSIASSRYSDASRRTTGDKSLQHSNTANQFWDKVEKRQKGISSALNRLTKEETLNEIDFHTHEARGGGIKSGDQLHIDDKRHVLSSYVHRFTGDHKPNWAAQPRPDGSKYMPHHANDHDWLRNTKFAVGKNGRLAQNVNNCHSTPTWPHGMHEETLDELSKKTLSNYIVKASLDRSNVAYASGIDDRAAMANKGATKKMFQDRALKGWRKDIKRGKGITRAVGKLAKEETLDELSKKTLGSYVKKASDRRSTDSYSAGHHEYKSTPTVDAESRESSRIDQKHRVGIRRAVGRMTSKNTKNYFDTKRGMKDYRTEELELVTEINKGAFHRWLGKPLDQKITAADVKKGLAAGGHAAKMANMARQL